ncbi:MAG: hypothetical protein EBT79_13960 [Actinobacteria bacterium]|nr:hypothetical protein [Actinomycetota bacterium]
MTPMKKHTHIALSAIAALSFTSCGGSSGSSDTTAAPDTTVAPVDTAATKLAAVTISVTVGKDNSPDRVEKVALGSEVTLTLTNPDADDEFHLHGYDLTTGKTKKGETSTITFVADKAGEFEVESHVSEQVYVIISVE